MRKFVEKVIASISRTELDLDYPHYDDKSNDRNEVEIPYHELSYSECPSIEIDEVIKILQSFKDRGANRVYIGEHCDHHGYYFYGVKLEEIK